MDTSNIVSVNSLVACSPFSARHIEKVEKNGMVYIGNKIQLTELTVVLGGSGEGAFPAGSKVWVRSELYTQQWAKDVFTVGEAQFILVPKQFIQLASQLSPAPLNWTLSGNTSSSTGDK